MAKRAVRLVAVEFEVRSKEEVVGAIRRLNRNIWRSYDLTGRFVAEGLRAAAVQALLEKTGVLAQERR